jgi:predicted ABC-type ATPase
MAIKSDPEIIEEARKYASKHSDEMIEGVVGDAVCRTVPEPDVPFTIFMAGSPGAGKTEWSKHLIELFHDNAYGVARIDADEFRSMLPDYNGDNSHLFQPATSALLSNAFRSVLKYKKNCILDTTLSKSGAAIANVGEAINKGRRVEIVYIYQEPTSAWGFVLKREAKEGRRIPLDDFAEKFVNAPKVVDDIMAKFSGKISLTVVIKDIAAGKEPTIFTDAPSIASVLKKRYNHPDEVRNLIQPSTV